MKKYKYLLLFIITFIILMPVTFAATTIRETVESGDDYSTLEENSVVIGVSKFSPETIVTASRAAQAGANDAMLYVSEKGNSKGYKAPGVYYYIDSIVGWFFLDTDNNATPVIDEETMDKLSKLDIYYVDNVEKVLEIEYKDNNIDEDSLPEGVSYKDNKLLVNATVKKIEFMTSDQKKVSYVMDTTTSKFIEDVTSCYTVSNNKITDYDLNCGSEIVIPVEIDGNKITGIANNAFKGKKLESVIIPETITSIGDNAFANNSLKEVVIKEKYDERDFSSYGNNVFGTFENVTYDNELTKMLSYADNNYVINYYKDYDLDNFDEERSSHLGIRGYVITSLIDKIKKNGYNYEFWRCDTDCSFEESDFEEIPDYNEEDMYMIALVKKDESKYELTIEKMEASNKRLYSFSKEIVVSMKESGTKNDNDIVLEAIKNLKQEVTNDELYSYYDIVTRMKYLEELEDLYDVDILLTEYGQYGGYGRYLEDEIIYSPLSVDIYYLKDNVLYQYMDNVGIKGLKNTYYPTLDVDDYDNYDDYVKDVLKAFSSKTGITDYEIEYTDDGLAYHKRENRYKTAESYYIKLIDNEFLESWEILFEDSYEDKYDENGYTKAECFEFSDGVITDYDGTCGVNVKIPDTIKGVAVTEIAGYIYDFDTDESTNAFAYSDLRSVVLPKNLKIIGQDAFNGNNLTEIDIPKTVITIGSHAFSFNDITSVEIPDSVTYIDYGAFLYNDIENIKIGDGITGIEPNTFSENKIKNLELSSNITYISYGAFSYNEITELIIPEGVETISEDAFSHNKISSLKLPSTLKNVDAAFNDNQLSDKDAFIYGYEYDYENDSYHKYIASYGGSNRKKVVIPEDTKIIGSGAFADCDIQEIVIPYGVEKIDYGAFAGNKLSHVSVPDSVSYIGSDVFRDNAFEGENQFIFFSDENGKKDYTTLIAYSNNENGYGWFDEKEIIIPDTVEIIYPYAFSSGDVDNLVIPYGVKEIGDYAFYNVTIEKEFTIPKSIEKIGYGVFDYYSKSEEKGFVYARNEDGTIDKSMLMAYIGYVDDGILSFPEGIVEIRENLMKNRSEINKIIFPSTLKKIGNSAFEYLYLDSVEFNNGLEIIGDEAFYYSNLTSINLPSSLKEIGKYAFGANYLKSVNVPGTVKEISYCAFYDNELEEITLNEGLEKIGEFAFASNSLRRVNIPGSVKELEDYAFYDNQFEEITLNEGLEKIGKQVFISDGIKLLTIPASVKSIDYMAFGFDVEEILVLGKKDSNDFEYLDSYAFYSWNPEKYELELPILLLPTLPLTVNNYDDSYSSIYNLISSFEISELTSDFVNNKNGTYSLNLNLSGTKTYSNSIFVDDGDNFVIQFKLYVPNTDILIDSYEYVIPELYVGDSLDINLEDVFTLDCGIPYSLKIVDYKE